MLPGGVQRSRRVDGVQHRGQLLRLLRASFLHRPPRRSVPAPAPAHPSSRINKKTNSEETCRRVFFFNPRHARFVCCGLEAPSSLPSDFSPVECGWNQLTCWPQPSKLCPVTKEIRQLLIQFGLNPNFKSQLFVFSCVSFALLCCLVVEASILKANRGGCPPPSSPLPRHGEGESLQSLMQEEGVEGDGPHSCPTLPF